MEKITLLILIGLSRFVSVLCDTAYIGPSMDSGIGLLGGGIGHYLLEGISLPTGLVMGLEAYVDLTNGQWLPFSLLIYRPIGNPSTTEQYQIMGKYDVTNQPAFSSGVYGVNFTNNDFIPVLAGDQIAFYSDSQSSSITAQFDPLNTTVYTRFSAPSPGVPAVGDNVTFARVGLGPTVFSLRVLVDASTFTVPTCAAGGSAVCEQICTDIVGGYVCSCRPSYTLDTADNSTCILAIQTCASEGNAICSHLCADFAGGYSCHCRPGFTLDSNGYSCIESDLSTFIGEPGRTGLPGFPGSQGQKGQMGEKGAAGLTGLQGQQGAKGEKGVPGIGGSPGDTGAIGATGVRGPVGSTGITGEKGSMGPEGYTGPMGPTGPRGYTGQPGINGLNGVQGSMGEKGERGETGPEGLRGMTGSQGSPGGRGSKGAKGEIGQKGERGLNGATGQVGPQGDTGLPGPTYKDVDECLVSTQCSHDCVNTIGSFYCTCNDGYVLSTSDNKTCLQALECAVNNGGCQHTCTERTGGYDCSCNKGYDLSADRHSCIDLDECGTSSRGGCSTNEVCVNVPGGSSCVPKTADTASIVACASAQAQSQTVTDCDSNVGLVSRNTVIGFIVWLVLLTILVLALLGCVLSIVNSKSHSKKAPYPRSRRSSGTWEDKSQRYSGSLHTRLPEAAYTYY